MAIDLTCCAAFTSTVRRRGATMRDGLNAVLLVSPALDRGAVLLIIVAEAIAVKCLMFRKIESDRQYSNCYRNSARLQTACAVQKLGL